MRCPSCEILYINGIRCHETGCPDAWRDYLRECSECGCDFKPEERHQRFCSDSCASIAHGIPYDFNDGEPEPFEVGD